MSTLPGGAADKAGLVHEALWGVYAMLKVLCGEADSICIEEPGVDGAEFHLQLGKTREQWQAKRQVLSQENWSLQLLKSKGVLTFFLDQARQGNSCVFASISEAPELRVLSENALHAENWEIFHEKFLAAKERRNDFNELRKHWNDIPEQEAFECLRRIRVEGARECTLESLLSCVLQATFTGPPRTALSVLHHFYLTSVHQTLKADGILKHLEKCGIKPREFTVAAKLRDFLLGITDSYIAGQRSKLIQAKPIPRQVASDIVTRLTTADHSLDLLLVGSAGGGKSACLLQIVESLRSAGVPVLAFRLDRIEPVSSTEALGKKLDLPESPAVVLARCFESQPTVLVVDQLDFVSATSGRHPDFFDTLAALVDEVRGLRSFGRIHLVLACRQFDFENDHRFRRLLPKDERPVSVALLTDLEVKDVIQTSGGDPARLATRQFELLRLPQNLSLFTEAGLAQEKAPAFITQKDLFDAYWLAKRSAVSLQRPNEAAQWNQVIERLTGEMSNKQELSVPKARLDEFSPELLGAMASQGVITFNGHRYGFGHESFFDYCFARNIAAGDTEFVSVLEGDEQQLFRRAQLRQVLVYLRDDDLNRYLKNVSEALGSKKIRSHLKLLVLELLAAFPNPLDEEFGILMPYLDSELDSLRNQKPNPAKMASRAFHTFFLSRSLFPVADRLGYIEKWLHSGDSCLENLMANYLRWQTEQHSDRVAELLEPFVGRTDSWRQRLRGIMEWTHLEHGRRFFELFLRLIDDGTLDDARDRLAQNGTFWSMLGFLAKSQPTWLAELAVHWLDRKVSVALTNGGKNNGVSFSDAFGVEQMFESARLAPLEYVKQVLPAILRAAQAFAFDADNIFLRDGVWAGRDRGPHIGLGEAYLSACEEAFAILSKDDPISLRPFIDELRPKKLYIANHLLLYAYFTAPVFYAEEAMGLLAAEPDRLLCGFSDNAHWMSRCLIEKSSPHCSEETFRKLETAVINYSTPYEKSQTEWDCKGHAAYNLASVLAPTRISDSTKEKLKEWQNKFSAPDGPPQGVRCYTVVSPVPEKEAECFSDDEWLQAIAKYNIERGIPDIKNLEKGGASHFAALLQTFLKKEPERFARLSLRFPDGTNSAYWMNILYALQEVQVASSLKCEVARRVFDSDSNACLMAVLDLLGAITDVPVPDDAVQFIKRMATEHPDPIPEPKDTDSSRKKSDIRIDGRNSVRGHAAEAIRALIYHDRRYLAVFEATIEHLVTDASLAVRACAAYTLMSVAFYDTPRALVLFGRLVDSTDCLFATDYVQRFIAAGLNNHLPELRPSIERMLSSSDKEVCQAGGTYSCLARLYHIEADDLAEAALAGNASCRLGVATVAKDNFLNPNCRVWCEAKLKLLFFDKETEIRKKAANCFWYLWHQPDMPLEQFTSLIQTFLSSPAFAEEPTFLLHTLDDTRQRVPDVILDICEHFVAKCAEQARDIRTALAADEYTVGKLVFRAYAQLEATEPRKRTLNLIDRMCEEGLQSTGQYFAEFER